MLMRPRVLSILTTRQCTAACDHCCIGASPRAKGAIPVERIHALIDEAKRIPTIERIVFTGGECFLLGKELESLIAHAHELEFRTRAITNGYWAVSEAAAAARAQALRLAGLTELMLSTGTFHQRFVPVARVVHAAKAAARVGIVVRISVERADQSEFDDAGLCQELAPEIASGKVHVSLDPWIADAGGRGSTEITHRRHAGNPAFDAEGRCAQILNVVTVTPDQQVLACCGFPAEHLPSLRMGAVSDRPLDVVLREEPLDLLKMWLHISGPVGIGEFVRRYVSDFKLPTCVSICQACVALQRSEVALRVITEHASEIMADVTAHCAALQTDFEWDHVVRKDNQGALAS